jgi:hypothetical protein
MQSEIHIIKCQTAHSTKIYGDKFYLSLKSAQEKLESIADYHANNKNKLFEKDIPPHFGLIGLNLVNEFGCWQHLSIYRLDLAESEK